MKTLILFLLFVTPFGLMAQKAAKPPKPSIPRAEKAMWDGRLDEAKQVIDITVESEKFMGNAKAWFVRGIIYASIDTSENEQYRALAENAYDIAVASFDKCNKIDGGKTGSFINGKEGFPLLENQIYPQFANRYFNMAIVSYQDEQDYKKAMIEIEKTMYFLPNDTSVLMNAGVFFAPMAEDWSKTISYINDYIKFGGASEDAYLRLYSVYREELKDTEKSLQTAQAGKVKFPNNTDWVKYELNIYITEKKYDDAKKMVQEAVSANPNDWESFYLLGQLHKELSEPIKAREAFFKSAELNPKSFDAAVEVANYYWMEAKVFKDEMGKLSNSKEDMAKLKTLDAKYVEKLKIYLPYIEKCEKLEPDNLNVLYPLLSVYQDLDNTAQLNRIKKKLKTLGEEID